ncbi:response regulator transcription factor [Undibacterium sp. Di27W]|uniref:response regulator transcription factor n=1 Tax=Undibacterium sp. Di27W TaxID=3413036 RepID=UPI003BF30CE4
MGNTSTWIAVVDDEAGIRRAMLRLLHSVGLEAYSFTSGILLLDSLHLRQPGCILLDLHMPDMSGYAVLARLALIAPQIPVIVMTASEVSDIVVRTGLSHAQTVLHKPFNDQDLFTAIEKALGLKCASDPAASGAGQEDQQSGGGHHSHLSIINKI